MKDARGNEVRTKHYAVFQSFEDISDLRELFPEGKADEMNWVFLSTSGVHGSYTTLDELESDPDFLDDDGKMRITVLVLHPRLCSIVYGEMRFERGDIPYLRGLARSTVDEITAFSKGNV